MLIRKVDCVLKWVEIRQFLTTIIFLSVSVANIKLVYFVQLGMFWNRIWRILLLWTWEHWSSNVVSLAAFQVIWACFFWKYGVFLILAGCLFSTACFVSMLLVFRVVSFRFLICWMLVFQIDGTFTVSFYSKTQCGRVFIYIWLFEVLSGFAYLFLF